MDLSMLTALRPAEVVFWSGAGISIDPPTRGRSGPKLTADVLTDYFDRDVPKTLADVYAGLEITETGRPRLETVLDVATRTYGISLLADALSDLLDPPPNGNHAFFAAHLVAGGRHVTANFDTCIERAGDGADVLHVHESFSSGLERLGARLEVIENGLPEPVTARLDEVLGDPGTKALVFVGYSGSDYFDVEPYLRSRGFPLLAGKIVAWLQYAEVEQPNRPGAAEFYLRYAPAASTVLLTGPLRTLTATLAKHWQLTPPPIDVPPAAPPQRSLTPTPGQRAAATTALYARMGLRNHVIAHIGHRRDLDPVEHEMLADALWGAGRYRKARRHWEQARAGETDDARARLAERRGAVRWIRGQLRRAERDLWAAIEEFALRPSTASAESRLRLLETYLRVLTHMRRLPDVRRFVPTERGERADAELTRLRGEITGLHNRILTQSASANFAGGGHSPSAEHAASFGQAESLHAWLNYQQADLRDRAEREEVADAEYGRLQERFRVIGALGDVPRVALLPGAKVAFTPWRVWWDFRHADVTLWHRIRLVGGFTARWLRR